MNIKHLSILTIALLAIFCSLNSVSYAQYKHSEKLKIATELQKSMVDKLLNPWYPISIDYQNGGFLSTFSYDFKPVGNQDKMIVTQSRHLWSTSKASELFPDVDYYIKGAHNGFEFLKNVMWDKEYGGFYTFTDRQGNVKKGGFAPKEAYGNSFAIYGLATYYEASGDTSALSLAKKCFWWLENHSHDRVHKGYFQHMQRDGTPIVRDAAVSSTSEVGYKDQNSSIHLLESLTQLYSVWPDSLLNARVKEMFLLVRDTITDEKGNLILFFKPDWTPVSFKDSTPASIKQHHNLDHVSFGHNVETAYLLLEASHALNMKNDTTTLHISKKMVDDALDNGWDKKVGGFYDEGYYFKNKPGITITADTKNWWAQAEGLNALLMMADEYPDDSHHYFQKFTTLWKYVQTYLIDNEHGDWYQGGIDKQYEFKTALKGQIWKGTYHNLRALMNCIMRLDPDKIPPTIPRNVKIIRKGKTLILNWNVSSDNKRVLGYTIYSDNKKTGFTPLNYFSFPENRLFDKAKLTVKAMDLSGNESGSSSKAL